MPGSCKGLLHQEQRFFFAAHSTVGQCQALKSVVMLGLRQDELLELAFRFGQIAFL